MGISIKSWKNDNCKKCPGLVICDYQIAPNSDKCLEFRKVKPCPNMRTMWMKKHKKSGKYHTFSNHYKNSQPPIEDAYLYRTRREASQFKGENWKVVKVSVDIRELTKD